VVGIEIFSVISQNKINIFVCWSVFESSLEQSGFLEQVEKCLLFVHALSDLVECSLLPEICDDIKLM